MLSFIVPLKSSQVSRSWETVSQLFERSIRSICSQTSSEFQVIVVCHEKPITDFSHPNLTYIQVNFPIPNQEYKSKEFDRTRKILKGIFAIKEQKDSSHIMVVDADDCISQNLAAFVNKNSQENGWFFNQGYYYCENNQFIRIMRKGFDRYCGTSNIIRENLYEFSSSMEEDKLVEYVYNYYRHREIRDTLYQKGIILKSLPFKGAIYITDNGENIYHGIETKKKNISWKSRIFRLKSLLDNRLLTTEIRHEFGLYDIKL